MNILGARFTYGSFFMLGLVALIWFVLNRTAFWRHLYAVGDDPPATIPAAVAVSYGPPLVVGAPVSTKGLVP